MSQHEPKAPYIYQPFGIQDKTAWFLGRIYAIAGVSEVTTIAGLTKQEAKAVLELLSPSVPAEDEGERKDSE